jgi:DsbC/DsbD-like thiol-disulfide interchange protein
LIPTSIAFDGLQPSKVEYPSPVRFKSAFAPDGLDVYEGSAALVATFSKGSLEGNKDIQGAATAQACNSQICLPPSKLSVSLSGRNE